MPFTRTTGAMPTASSRISWFTALLLTSEASLPCFGTTAFAELVSTMACRQLLFLQHLPRFVGKQVIPRDVYFERLAPHFSRTSSVGAGAPEKSLRC